MDESFLDKKRLLEATNEVYRLTLLFPKKEPLRDKMRELSDEVLAHFVSLPAESAKRGKKVLVRNAVKKIEILESFCEVASSQNWVKPEDLLNLQREYNKIKEEFLDIEELPFKSIEPKPKKPRKVVKEKEPEVVEPELEEEKKELKQEEFPKQEEMITISPRQKRILEFLKNQGKAQVWQIKEVFSDVSKRTLRRDFKKLLKDGLVERKGERNDTYYVLKVGQ
ncbi:MAG: DeoR family transcriptional regulator [Candidatus Nealsonbacteria bacterium]|nr:DeoR family transcriptional regulator [Candidatus Nealsonbacteria bacterium]